MSINRIGDGPTTKPSIRFERNTMSIDRRNILFAAAALATTSQYAEGHTREKPVSQQELDEAIWLHGMWLADMTSGQRCTLGGRDLSGLRFGVLGGGPVDLNGADFAQADLSRTEADDVLVHHCSFNGAKFDDCRWRQPVFAFADMRRVSAKRAEWGTPALRGSPQRSLADFSHAVLNSADLSEARICGYFYGTKLVGAFLVQADLSFSDFLGPKRYEMTTFSGAHLIGAKLRHCRISSASFFNADCSETDFSHSVFSDVRMKGCNLSCASFHGTEIEQTMFSPDQIRDADFGWAG
jgi:uncharacterized protein YjbI with pentapeptide repeats